MTLGKRIYWILALVAVMVLAGAAVTVTSRLTSASGPDDPTPAVQTCDCAQQDGPDDASESAVKGADTDNIEEECQCGSQDEADDAGTDTVVPCSNPTGADDDAAEAKGVPDTDNVEEQCGPQDAED